MDDARNGFARQLGDEPAYVPGRRPGHRPAKGEFLILACLADAGAAILKDTVQIVDGVIGRSESAAEQLRAGQIPHSRNRFLLDALLLDFLAVFHRDGLQVVSGQIRGFLIALAIKEIGGNLGRLGGIHQGRAEGRSEIAALQRGTDGQPDGRCQVVAFGIVKPSESAPPGKHSGQQAVGGGIALSAALTGHPQGAQSRPLTCANDNNVRGIDLARVIQGIQVGPRGGDVVDQQGVIGKEEVLLIDRGGLCGPRRGCIR